MPTKTEQKYRPVVIQAILELSIGKPETSIRAYGKGQWFTAREIFDYIHGHYGDRYWWQNQKRSPSPSDQLVNRIINQLRREGYLTYDPDSLGSISRWMVEETRGYGNLVRHQAELSKTT